MSQSPVELLTAKELLEKARRDHGVRVSLRKFRWWQQERLLDAPTYVNGRGHTGYYGPGTLARLVSIARGRQSLTDLRHLDRRPARQSLTVNLDVVASETLPDGRIAHTLRDHSILITPPKGTDL